MTTAQPKLTPAQQIAVLDLTQVGWRQADAAALMTQPATAGAGGEQLSPVTYADALGLARAVGRTFDDLDHDAAGMAGLFLSQLTRRTARQLIIALADMVGTLDIDDEQVSEWFDTFAAVNDAATTQPNRPT